MKKILIMTMVLLSMLAAVSCGGGDSDSSKKEVSKPVTLIFATQDTPGTPTYVGFRALADKLAELSGGNMTIEFVNMTKYASVPEMFDAMVDGSFDMAAAGYTEIRFNVPEILVLGLIIKDFAHLERIMASPFGQKLNNLMYEAGIVASAPIYIGTRRVTSNIPINSVKDLKGLKLRTTPTGTNFAHTVGANGIPIAWSELPKALAEGVVEAQENPLSLIESAGLYQWQTHIAYTEHAISSSGIFLNRAKYDTLSTEQKMWYNQAVAYGIQMCNNIVYNDEATLLDKFVNEYGMTVTYPDLDEIKAVSTPNFDYIIDLFGEDFVNEARSIE